MNWFCSDLRGRFGAFFLSFFFFFFCFCFCFKQGQEEVNFYMAADEIKIIF